MADELDGLTIARQLIAQEAADHAGFLDLGRLGLTRLPEELFCLTHLRRLNLGAGMADAGGEWHRSVANFSPNAVDASLEPLSTALPELEALSVSDTEFVSLVKLADFTRLELLDCSWTQISDLAPVAGLNALQTFDCSGTQISDLAPLAGLSALQTLNCLGTQISDVSPLAGLSALRELNCTQTQISDLGPLAGLNALETLICSWTEIHDLGPIAELCAIQTLYCARTQISNLGPLAGLDSLRTLACGATPINDIGPIARLSALQTLNLWGTQVNDLEPVTGLGALQSLDCRETQISNLGPLAGLSALQTLNCSGTQISNLGPLAGLSALQTLYCSGTPISDLGPVAGLTALQTLDCSGCRLIGVPDALWYKPSLQRLVLYESHLPGVLVEVLSQSPSDDCLQSLRAHLRDLAEGGVAVPDAKLMVLGNGRVGKTQICRRLRGEDYDDTVPSTHGIIVTSATLPAADGGAAAKLHIWDFGGQDIYHGTHALFMRARAIFLLVWTPERERSGEQVHDGMLFRDYPLAYWLEYVRHLGGSGSPVLLIQTRCDRPEHEAVRPPVSDEALADFPFRKIVQYSARLDRSRAALDDALAQAVAWLTEQEGIVTIGAGRLRVKRRFEVLRDADAALPPEHRRYRTISQEHFLQLCSEEGGISSPEHLLGYLHNAGIVFYRHGLFDDRIILDQSWALEAVYAVFHRQKCYKQLRQLGGRFTRPLLEALVWDGYSIEEQKLFLSMMESCGICFVHRRHSSDDDENEYIAADLLPERDEVQAELDARWDPHLSMETAEFEYALLHPGMVRSVISRIGSEAGMSALYWKDGLCVYEKTTGSRALLDQQIDESWSGRIRVQTQSGQAASLLEKLEGLIETESERAGTKPTRVAATSSARRIALTVDAADAAAEHDASSRPTPMQFAQERTAQREYCVSYAWGDVSPEGAEREEIVDRLCDAAEQRRVTVIRDKNVLGLGESISKFMQRIGRADRVFVVLSDKYLKSPYCMFELFEVWRNSRADPMEFIERVKVYTLPSAQISTPLDRVQHAIYWKQNYEALDAAVKPHGLGILGEADLRQYKLMQDFTHRVSDILATVADVLQPRSFEHLEKHWLDDLMDQPVH
jgi:internalin A